MRTILAILAAVALPAAAADRLPLAFEARWESAMQELEFMELALAPPIAVRTEHVLPPEKKPPAVKTRMASRTLCASGRRKVFHGKRSWRCR